MDEFADELIAERRMDAPGMLFFLWMSTEFAWVAWMRAEGGMATA